MAHRRLNDEQRRAMYARLGSVAAIKDKNGKVHGYINGKEVYTSPRAEKGAKVNESNLVDYIMAFEGGTPSNDDVLELFSYLIKTGQAWRLQGMYGRQAASFIESGVIDRKGKINWKAVSEPEEKYYEEDRTSPLARYHRIDGWRGYSIPDHAVAGSSDTGMYSDSPCPSDKVKVEIADFRNYLKEHGIKSRMQTGGSSNAFCGKRWVVVSPGDYARARELSKEYRDENVGLRYLHNAD